MRKTTLFFLVIFSAMVPLVSAFHLNSNHADSWNITVGTGGGPINATWERGGPYIWINETGGSPAFITNFNITLEKEDTVPQYLAMSQYYLGNPAHIVELQWLNQSDRVWYVLDLIPNGVDYTWLNVSMVLLNHADLDQNKVVEFRIVHTSPGNAGHWLRIDYISLETIDDDDDTLTAWDINWLTSFLWLALVGIGYFSKVKTALLFGGLMGIVLGLYLLAISGMVGIIVLIFSVYLMYEGTGDQ